MIDLNYAEIPLHYEDDINKEHTTWANERCVKMDEGRWVTYYVMHHTETRIEETHYEQYVEKEICLAVPVRVRKGDGTKALREACQNDDVFNEVFPLFAMDNIEIIMAEVIDNIRAYDISKNVNGFYYQGKFMWLDKDERMIMGDRFSRELEKGVESTQLVYEGEHYKLTPQEGLLIINELKSYADECFDVTQTHIDNVSRMHVPDAIINYDYTAGYPQMLKF